MDGITCDDPTAEAQTNPSQPLPTTPVRMPLEILPFSPSQVTVTFGPCTCHLFTSLHIQYVLY